MIQLWKVNSNPEYGTQAAAEVLCQIYLTQLIFQDFEGKGCKKGFGTTAVTENIQSVILDTDSLVWLKKFKV